MADAIRRMWIGAHKLTPKPGGVTVDYTNDRLVATLEYHGPHELCVAMRPAVGSYVTGFAGMRVDRSTVRKAQAPGFGELTVYLSKADEADGDGAEPLREVFWLEVERDLIQHPRYQAGGGMPLADTDLTALALWLEEPNEVDRAAWKYSRYTTAGTVVGGYPKDLTTQARDAARKILKGIDSYLEYTPIAVEITFTRSKPSTTRTCGKRLAAKPFSACPDGYVWLRTEDRHTRSGRHGKWQRTQRYTGAKSWDTDLYEVES